MLSARFRIILVVLFFGLLTSSQGWGGTPALKFYISDKLVQSITLDELKQHLKTHEINYNDPHYSASKRFAAFSIQDVLQLAYADDWKDTSYSDATFTALDGYKAVGPIDKLDEEGGYLAFADLDASAENSWLPIGSKKANPGPFYLFWTAQQQSTSNGYPWPWQIASFTLVRFTDQYPEVYPKGAVAGSDALHGFTIFKDRCFRCHAINQQGGKIGPDLNAPQSIVAYRSANMIREFIRQPSRYRYTYMPDHGDLSEQDLDALLAYFWHKSRDK